MQEKSCSRYFSKVLQGHIANSPQTNLPQQWFVHCRRVPTERTFRTDPITVLGTDPITVLGTDPITVLGTDPITVLRLLPTAAFPVLRSPRAAVSAHGERVNCL